MCWERNFSILNKDEKMKQSMNFQLCDDDDENDVVEINDDWLLNHLSLLMSILNFLHEFFLFLNFELLQQLPHDDDDENDEDVRMFPVIQLNYLEMVMKNHEWSFDLIN